MENYEKLKSIGKGNYGKAILCRNKIDKQLYVLKSINIGEMSEDQVNSALMEVELLKSLKHPYIIKFINSFFYLKYLVIVMEYAECGDLSKIIKTQKKINIPLREEVIMNWFVQLCFAVKYLHDRKILHRDLKLSNIFICGNGEVKLGDFGISKVLESTNAFAQSIVGTPYYLSPEICNKEPYSYKSDIWSLGCLLYELFTCNHVFEAKNISELCDKILKTDYKKISKVYSKESSNLVDLLLNKNPDERPDIDEILEMNCLLKYIKLNLIRQLSNNEKENENEISITNSNFTSKVNTLKSSKEKKNKLQLIYNEIPIESNLVTLKSIKLQEDHKKQYQQKKFNKELTKEEILIKINKIKDFLIGKYTKERYDEIYSRVNSLYNNKENIYNKFNPDIISILEKDQLVLGLVRKIVNLEKILYI